MFFYVLICSYMFLFTSQVCRTCSLQAILGMPSFLTRNPGVQKRSKAFMCLASDANWIFCTSWNMKTVGNQTKLKAYFDAIVVGSAAMILDTRTNVQMYKQT